MSLFRIPQSPQEWSKGWADRLVNTLELIFSQVSDSAQENAQNTSNAQAWFLG
jgi:hypothetical protein